MLELLSLAMGRMHNDELLKLNMVMACCYYIMYSFGTPLSF
jgi:hypothetical protein